MLTNQPLPGSPRWDPIRHHRTATGAATKQHRTRWILGTPSHGFAAEMAARYAAIASW